MAAHSPRGHALGMTSCDVFAALMLLQLPALACSTGTLRSCGGSGGLVAITKVEFSPPIPRVGMPQALVASGQVLRKGVDVNRLSTRLDIFYCRRVDDCMLLLHHEASLCQLMNLTTVACGALNQGDPIRIEGEWHLPQAIFRGPYDLELSVFGDASEEDDVAESSCFRLGGVNVLAHTLTHRLVDKRDALVAFVIAASSSRALGALFPAFSAGMLPQISGFLFIGILAGPYAANLITKLHIYLIGEVINKVSLAFIAGAAGAEIFFPELQRLIGPMMLQVFLVSIAVLSIVTSGIMALSLSGLVDFPVISMQGSLAAKCIVALLVSSLMIARSPASAIAVIAELECSHMSAAKLVLGVTVLSDIFVLVSFALCGSLARVVTEGGDFGTGAIVDVFVEIIASLALGAVAGMVMRFSLPADGGGKGHGSYTPTPGGGEKSENSRWEPVCVGLRGLLLIAILFLTFRLADEAPAWTGGYRLEPLLACTTAACLCGNDNLRRGRLLEALGSWTAHILLPFFTLAGASLPLPGLQAVLLAAATVVMLRMLSFACGSTIAGLLTRRYYTSQPTTDASVYLSWMTMVAQAGVTLGLVLEVQEKFEKWGKEFGTLVIGIVVINQLVGPVLCRVSLQKIVASEPNDEGSDMEHMTDETSERRACRRVSRQASTYRI